MLSAALRSAGLISSSTMAGLAGRSITGTTLRRASTLIAPARSIRGTVPVRSRMVDGTLSAHWPPSR